MISNIQLSLAVGLPTLLVLVSLAVSVRHTSGIRDEIRATREDLRAGCAEINRLLDRLL